MERGNSMPEFARHIVQIIPAEGWYAEYRPSDHTTSLMPLLCFALVEWEEYGRVIRDVQPMVYNGQKRCAELCDTQSHFFSITQRPPETVPTPPQG